MSTTRQFCGPYRGAHGGPYCGDCGDLTRVQLVDFGYGVTEFWGSVSCHTDVRPVSTCCEGDLFADIELSVPYEIPERDDDDD